MSDLNAPNSHNANGTPGGDEGTQYPAPTGQPLLAGTQPYVGTGSVPTPPAQSRGRRILIAVIGIVAALLVAGVVRWGLTSAFAGPSKQDTIDKSVAQIKEDSDLPRSVDQITTWTDVKAEEGAIHYVYTISAGVDPAALTVATIRKTVLPTLCSTTATKRILDADIAMRYSYTLTGSNETVETTFTKADC